MNFFKEIQLNNFRNFINFKINFTNRSNIIIGPNGSGKTNILESISLFDKGRGFRKDVYKNMINKKKENEIFFINSEFHTLENYLNLNLTCELNNNKYKKILLINGSNSLDSKKFFENLFSVIYFLPEMERIFLSTPSLRRNFIDRLIHTADKNYLKISYTYKKKIIERSNILKNEHYDINWIKQIENEIVEYGLKIYSIRDKYIEILNNEIKNLQLLSNNFFNFKLMINDNFLFENNFNLAKIENSYLSNLINSRKYDSIVGGCKIGPHKSDINGYHIDENFDLSLCSTGQQKAAVLLIIIAQSNYLINKLKIHPIILLYEVCSHLDKFNRDILLELINSLNVQTFLTGNEKKIFSFLSTKPSYYYIN